MKKPDYQQLYQTAETQGGYFTAAQARRVGFTWERLSCNVKTGKFQRARQGVYRLVQFPASPYEDLFVAWLQVGEQATVSHESALVLYDLSDVLPDEIHLTVPRTASLRRAGLRLHTATLSIGEVTSRNGLPVTTVERTLLDVMRSQLSPTLVEQAVQAAIRRGLTSPQKLLAQAQKRSQRAWKSMHAILEAIP
ncbi:MAG TPA: hypothetical protein PLT26_13235 [Anaerolineaceae bacterium]|nr:hypothetical protein [Anaerolineaceae bacterium]HQH86998.1 hypothetical protein [Anaerolineaceae bacterium]